MEDDSKPAWRDPELRVATTLLVLTLAVGTVVYTLVEGWSLLDAFYFCIVTLATIGYGDFAPKTAAGKLFTIGYIIVGIGLVAIFAKRIAERLVDRRLRRREALTRNPNGQQTLRTQRRNELDS
ncbi:MAG TPA: potassium channel family protein [Chloroflexota bacterium]|nr:potassium channel family protein [Chloroflexota bacterium]